MADLPGPYSQDVLTRISNVHWADPGPALSMFLGWSATMIDVSGGGAPPLWAPNTETVMEVNVDGLPPLDRTRLVVDPELGSSGFQDEVTGSFPDGAVGQPGSGTIFANYFASQKFGLGVVNGNVTYRSDVGLNNNPFNGASVLSITVTVQLRPIEVRDHGYDWFAIAGTTGLLIPAKRIGGEAASAGTLILKSTLNLKDKPPTFTFSDE
jgi:hypothetical protein